MSDENSERTDSKNESDAREVTMRDRISVCFYADRLAPRAAVALLDAVRCCGEFPECSHVLEYTEGAVTSSRARYGRPLLATATDERPTAAGGEQL